MDTGDMQRLQLKEQKKRWKNLV
uniref:Uncharacterized protein n=1 Tax=Tetranychus urticae TaxID=32264 RepID=T1K0C9_TETUR